MIRTMETRNETWHRVNDVPSASPVHPGDILGRELKERGISQKAFAGLIGMQPSHLSALIHGMRSFTPAVAEKIASGLSGIPADFWTRMQSIYNRDNRSKKENTSHLVTGYGVVRESPAWALNDPGYALGNRHFYTLSIPPGDRALLEQLAARLGWTLEKDD
ncbi:MAG: helix-turn-helix domain-containing protein [Bacteroidales bacterium]|nr:helix-turn-helix domain-containing protein [Bacteroidales bacterium]